jgi:adenine C2-methylase RlmN of 23S rRNA A2503 and tRNA A37
VVLYWSLYSLDPAFRRRWLPRAQDPHRAMKRLLDWQNRAGGRVVLHWALIAGENDQDETFGRISDFVRNSGLEAKLNLVRYNPHSARTGTEAGEDRYAAALETIGAGLAVPGSKVVSRVGFDVKASCGMFMGERA